MNRNCRKGNILLVAAIFTALAVALLGGYFYWQHGLANKSSSPISEEENKKLQPPVGSNETAGWKTYVNKRFSYEFRYPPLFIPTNIAVRNRGDLDLLELKDANKVTLISFQVNTEPYSGEISNMPDLDSFPVNVDGVEGVEIIIHPKNPVNRSIIVDLPLGSHSMTISTSLDNRPLLDQVLSTFQFLDTSVTHCLKNADCPQGYKCSANCDVNAPGGADCSIIAPPPKCVKSSP